MRRVSVIVPARNEAARIAEAVAGARAQAAPGREVEVIVADDGSTDGTAEVARAAGARVVELGGPGGNPGAARNRGAMVATGDPLIFLDADCVPAPGWLDALLAAHDRGETIVGGSLELAPGLGVVARCDHFSGAYHVHPRRPAGAVPNHPPANLSVRTATFRRTRGFTERWPVADGHEELGWQAELARAGERIWFEPAAVAHHRNRTGWRSFLRRHYRWGYSALESKTTTRAARLPWLYRHPRLLLAAAVPLALAATGYTVACWLRAGRPGALLYTPGLLAARLAYAAGFIRGGLAWLDAQEPLTPVLHPR